MSHLKNQVEELRYEVSTKDITIEVCKQSMASLTSELEAIKQQSSVDKMILESKLEQLQGLSSVESEEKQRHISQFMSELEAKHTENLALNEEVKCVLLECNELKTELRANADEIADNADLITGLKCQLAERENAYSELSVESQGLKDCLEILEGKLVECTTQLDEVSSKLGNLMEELDLVRAEKDHIEVLYLEAQGEATKNAGAFVMLEAAEAKQKQTAVELTHALKKGESLGKELKKTLRDSKELQRKLEMQLGDKMNECVVRSMCKSGRVIMCLSLFFFFFTYVGFGGTTCTRSFQYAERSSY